MFKGKNEKLVNTTSGEVSSGMASCGGCGQKIVRLSRKTINKQEIEPPTQEILPATKQEIQATSETVPPPFAPKFSHLATAAAGATISISCSNFTDSTRSRF
jgi:hypothetical protein